MIFDYLSEVGVIGDSLVEIEILVNDFLDDLLDLVVESNADIFQRVGINSKFQRGVLFQPVHHSGQE